MHAPHKIIHKNDQNFPHKSLRPPDRKNLSLLSERDSGVSWHHGDPIKGLSQYDDAVVVFEGFQGEPELDEERRKSLKQL